MIYIYTDGACSGNPGPGGWGVIIRTDEGAYGEFGGYESDTTNNRMELTAVLAALDMLVDWTEEKIQLYTDSKYVSDGINKHLQEWIRRDWKLSRSKNAVKNKDLWLKLYPLIDKLDIECRWVPRNSTESMARADWLAKKEIEHGGKHD